MWIRLKRRCSKTRLLAWRLAGPVGSDSWVGVNRAGQADALRAHGADIVVSDLADLLDAPDAEVAR